MKKVLSVVVFTLATLVWAAAQQPGSTPGQSGGQTTPGSQSPNAGQTMPPDHSAPPSGAQAGTSGEPEQVPNAPVTTGCLAGTSPNFTITDTAGKNYKLNLPPGADPAVLTPHVGEQVAVMGDVKNTGGTNSIDVMRLAKGSGTCPGGASGKTANPNTTQPPKQ